MNKDVKGLIKYILLVLINWLMPTAIFFCCGIALFYENFHLACLCLSTALVLFILYFILPIIFTYKAMKNHWSKYLDKFFYNKFVHAIGLLILPLATHFALKQGYEFMTIYSILLSITPSYCVTFIVLYIIKKLSKYE